MPRPLDPRPCPLCGAAARALIEFDNRLFIPCPGCDLIFVPRSHHLPPDEQRRRYLLHQNTSDNTGYVAMFEEPIRAIQRHCPDVRRILDFGCGPGPVLVELLRRAGYDARGYDPFFAPDADLSAPFDLVVSTETFEHFAAPAAELRRILGLVRPQGYLAIMTRFHPGADRFAGWWYARDPTHVAFYSTRTLGAVSQSFGLTILHCDEMSFAIMKRSRP